MTRFIFLILSFQTLPLSGQTWVDISHEIYVDDRYSIIENKRKAKQEARELAIEKIVGVKVSSLSLSSEFESSGRNANFNSFFTLFSLQSLEGTIINEKNITTDVIFDDYPKIVVTGSFQVKKYVGNKDIAFNPTAELNKYQYKIDDLLTIQLKSNKECYYQVYYFDSNDIGYCIIPNEIEHNSFLEMDGIINLPTSNNYELFIEINKDDITPLMEYILVIFSKSKFNLPNKENGLKMYEIMNVLSQYPRSEYEVIPLPYIITE